MLIIVCQKENKVPRNIIVEAPGTSILTSSNINQENVDESFPYKIFELDENGNIVFSDIDIKDFQPSQQCAVCHPHHYDEWKLSSHHKTLNNSIFKIQRDETENKFPEFGNRFCSAMSNFMTRIFEFSLRMKLLEFF